MRQQNFLFQEQMRFWLAHWYRVIYDLYILITSSSSLLEFITNESNDLLPVGLLAQLVERCTGIAEVKGSNPVQAWNFSGFLFATAKVASTITAMKIFDVITLICVGDVRVRIATVFFPSQDRFFAKRHDVQAYNSHAKDEASFSTVQKRLFSSEPSFLPSTIRSSRFLWNLSSSQTHKEKPETTFVCHNIVVEFT